MNVLCLLFVCDTDTTLAPLAAASLSREAVSAGLGSCIQIEHAGAFAGLTPRPIDRRILKLAEAHRLNLPESNSRTIDPTTIERQDLIVTMNDEDYWHIKTLKPDITADTLRLFMEFSDQLGLREMPDPLQGEISFKEAYELVCKTTATMLPKLRAEYDLQPIHSSS